MTLQPEGTLVVLLWFDPARHTPAALDERLAHVLRSERPDVLEGLSAHGVVAVLVGPPNHALATLANLPRSERLQKPIAWYGVSPEGAVWGSPSATPGMMDTLRRAVAGSWQVASDPSALAALERAGENKTGEVGQERLFGRGGGLRRAPGTLGLGVILLAFFGLQLAWKLGYSPTAQRMGSMIPRRVLGGEWWRLLSAGFLHLNVEHLLGNLQALLVCYYVELALGSSRFVVLFTLSVLGGSALGVFTSNLHIMHLGASGGIFGLATALFVLTLRDQRFLPGITARNLRVSFGVMLGLNFLASFGPGVSLSAHAGGAAVGLVLVATKLLTVGHAREWMGEKASPRAKTAFRVAAAVCVALSVLSVGISWAKGRPWDDSPRELERVTFEIAPVSIELPTEIGAPYETGEREETAGRPGDALLVALIRTQLGVVVPEASVKAELEAAVRGMGDQTPKGMKRRSPPKLITIAGRPAIFADEVTENGAGDAPRYLFVFGDQFLVLQFFVPAKASAEWKALPERAVETLRYEKPLL